MMECVWDAGERDTDSSFMKPAMFERGVSCLGPPGMAYGFAVFIRYR